MSWLLFALAAPTMWAASTHLDKLLVARYFRDAGVAVLLVYTALLNLPLLALLAAWKPDVLDVPARAAILMLGSGVAYLLGIYFFLRALQDEDASGIAPLYQATPLFACLLGAIALHERLGPEQWAGIGCIVLGASLLSFERRPGRRRPKLKARLVGFMLAGTFLIAVSSLVFKIFSDEDEYWPATFWTYLGQTLIGFAPLLRAATRRQFTATLEKRPALVLSLNGVNEVVNLAGGLSMRYALMDAPLSVVQAVAGTTPLFVFAFGAVLTLWFPRIAREDLSRGTVILRIASAIIVVGGVALVGAAGA